VAVALEALTLVLLVQESPLLTIMSAHLAIRVLRDSTSVGVLGVVLHLVLVLPAQLVRPANTYQHGALGRVLYPLKLALVVLAALLVPGLLPIVLGRPQLMTTSVQYALPFQIAHPHLPAQRQAIPSAHSVLPDFT